MKNISFDNPYLLLLLLPIAVLIALPFLIAIRRENKSKSSTASLILHFVIALCAVLALAGMISTTVMTETEVIVVADVSYSANRNLDRVDASINELASKLPRNSQMGVVCFGKDQKLVTEAGGSFVTVRESGVDDSATDISAALHYASQLFGEGVIKRIVLITDGKETDTDAMGRLIGTVENLYADNIYIDAIYLDDNLAAGVQEVQISGVDFNPSTYLHHQTTADVLVQSATATNAIVSLYSGDVNLENRAVSLIDGFNVLNFELPTETVGSFDYRIEISAEADTSTYNNAYSFTQTVTGTLNVLLISGDAADLDRATQLFGEGATIDAYINKKAVPCSVEEICKYDEIVISNVDVRELNNFTAFVDAVDKAVSLFGKSLVTMGDLQIQNKTDDVLKQLEDMLPVKFGNNDQDPKLYTLVIDTSRSMQNFSRLLIAKESAKQLLGMLGDDDYVMVVNFWGEINVLQAPTKLGPRRSQILQKIQDIDPYQGTVIGTALNVAGEQMIELAYDEKQIMLISDGMSYDLETDNPVEVVTELAEAGIVTSVIHPAAREEGIATLRAIAEAGGGEYYEIRTEEDLLEIMFSEIADDLTESIIEKQTAVTVNRGHDTVMEGIDALPDIFGYAYAKAKASASTVLTVKYVKNSGKTVDAPLYSYWNYGNGRVASFTSSLSGEWTAGWQGNEGDCFFQNIVTVNTPVQRIDYPYTLNVTYDGTYSEVEMIPVTLNPYATADATVILPDGQELTERLIFDSSRYFYKFETPHVGKYRIRITYAYGDYSYTSESVFHLSYSPEYDSFAAFDPSSLHAAIRNRGTVSEETVPTLINDEHEVATYTVSFTVPLMILAVVLYVADIMIRKLKKSDIKSFFGKKMTKGGVK